MTHTFGPRPRLAQTPMALFAALAAAVLSSAGPPASAARAPAPATEDEAGRRSITLDDLARIRDLSDIQASPDGKGAVIRISYTDMEKDVFSSDLWHLDLEPGDLRRLTTDPGREESPRFSPDGRTLAFIAARDGGKARVYGLPLQGGESRALFSFAEDVEEFAWFPDGERIVFVAKEPDPDRGGGDRKKGEKKIDVMIITRAKFKADGEGYLDGRYQHLWIVNLATGAIRKITEGDFDHSSPEVSPDGRLIAFVSNRTDDPDTNSNTDIFAVPSRGGPVVPVSDAPGAAATPRWSPDGRSIAYLEQKLPDNYGANLYLWVAPVRGGTILPSFGEPRCLTEDLDRGVGEGSHDGEASPYPIWSPDSRRLYVTIADRARLHAYAVNPTTGARKLLIGGDRMVELFTPSGDGSRLIFGLSDGTSPRDVHVASSNGKRIRRLTRLNEWLDGVRVRPPQRFTYRSFDGWEIEGWVVTPHGFEEDGSYPTVLDIHGGPQSYYGWSFSPFFQLLAARGYLVIYTNPRGSTTYGETFTNTVRGRYGLEDFRDIMIGLDTVAALGWVDEENLFVTGYSYGGMMTNWAITQTDRFRAAASGAGLADYGASVGPDDIYADWIAEFGGAPWDVPERYSAISPIFHVRNARTPTLFLHGVEDDRDPTAESERMYLALRLMGVETELALFPGESHDLDNVASHGREYMRLVIDWFDRHRK